jgi:S-methylmethionine-dependent homocysteine/selenocysteine methylase
MSADEAERYHATQIASVAASQADMVAAYTLSYPEEAIGIVRAARAAAMPVAITFTVEIDGRRPSGDTLQSAIEEVDRASEMVAAYYLINCAHPDHFAGALRGGGAWTASRLHRTDAYAQDSTWSCGLTPGFSTSRSPCRLTP